MTYAAGLRNGWEVPYRRHVQPLWIQVIGKEANRLEEVQA